MLSSALGRLWRGIATALSFLIFGLGGLLLGGTWPLLAWVVHRPDKRQRLARRIIHHAMRGFVGLMRTLGVLDYRLHDCERLQRPGLLVLANHPTLIDVVFLLALIPHADCVVKGRLARNLFTRGPIRAAGYITNNEPQDVLDAARASLAKGNALILFPEGTRSVPGRALKFRRGAANIALRTPSDITPVLIDCQPSTLTKGEPWYHIPARRVMLNIKVLPDMPPEVTQAPDASPMPPSRAARTLTRELADTFATQLESFQQANAAQDGTGQPRASRPRKLS
ncbi:lysophospholipid acyltransferase family protein [Cobetia sp. Dlab-2-AX]|uniref:lysophospholipid acyltransferase family protein n=1 Tax=unclassified Cobetia TaxID=2609414 RepID=UPI002097AC8B|nr:1-acyl-sn-glycerol-3-phosphate acyltransferase [Cobetia sp. Dlab-2-AX]MCO7234247.1 1-acyl-sn-glycerol-3-phosphate acyltransferase [Cobetia sp. Dlab-2-U]